MISRTVNELIQFTSAVGGSLKLLLLMTSCPTEEALPAADEPQLLLLSKQPAVLSSDEPDGLSWLLSVNNCWSAAAE
jgi:hypothetical protein